MVGVSLGSAYFEFLASNQDLIVKGAQAEAAAKKNYAEIAKAAGVSAASVERAAKAEAAAVQQFSNARSAATLKTIRSYNDQADAAEKAAQRTIAANTKAAGGFEGVAKAALGFGVAATGVATGAALVHQSMTKIAEETQKAAQAQFGLHAAFATSTQRLTEFSKAQGASIGRTPAEIQQAIVLTATLAKNYGFTDAELQTVIKRTADYAALTNREFLPAVQDVVSAMRGEGDAAERLGLALQKDALKSIANLTAEQKRNFFQLSVGEHSRIAYLEFLRQTSDAEGTAAKRAGEGVGAYQNLDTAIKNLAATIGNDLGPSAEKGAEKFAKLTGAFEDWIKANDAWVQAQENLKRAGAPGFSGTFADLTVDAAEARRRLEAEAAAIRRGTTTVPDPFEADRGRHEGADVAEAARIRKAADATAKVTRERRAKEILEQRRKDVEARADLEIKGLEKEKQAAERAHQTRRALLEQTRDAEIKAAEDSRDGQIKAIEQEAQAAADGYNRRIREAEQARDKERQLAEDTRDNGLKQIEVAEQAARDANASQIRDLEIRRDRERQAAEDRRDDAIKILDQEKRAREQARRQEDRDLEDETQDILRDLEARHKKVEDGFDRQARAAERAHDRDIRGIERAAQREDDRHRKALAAIEKQADAATRMLDIQIQALDVADRQADAAERMANLQKKVADAQSALTKATGTGTPEEIAQAREELTRAIKGGDETSIQNARERLQQLAGQGAAAVKKAQEELAEAQAEIQKETTKEAREAERERLQVAKEKIRQEADAQKEAENERNRRRELDIQGDKRAADEKYKATKAGIDKRRDQERESYAEAVRRERDLIEQHKRGVEDRRRKEDEADQDKRRELAETYELEQRQIKATYDDEETGVIPALRRARDAADREFKAKREVVTAAYDEEQRRIKEVYDDPVSGVLAKLREQAEEARRQYDARKTVVNEAYNAERDRIKEVYDDPVTGLFQKLEDAKQKTIDSLNDQVGKWQSWKTDVVKEITEALTKLDAFLTKVGALDRIGTVTINGDPVSGNAGGRQGGPGGDLAYGPVVRNASPDSYWTSGGTHGGHPAADIFAPKGSPIYAPVGGSTYTGSDGKGGNWAVQRGDDGRAYYFAHGDVPFASGRVERGQQIGEVGNTGNASATAPHLHFAIASRPDLFGELGGSGDIDGDSSYWGAGGTANGGGRGDEEIEITLFGRTFKVRTSGANIPGDVGRWIKEGIKIAGVPSSWANPLAEIAAAESGQRNADGSVVIGSGDPTAVGPVDPQDGQQAHGLMQIKPSTFAAYAVPGHTYIYGGPDSVAAAARYIGKRYGSPRGTPYYDTGAFDWRGVAGYRHGGWIPTPSLIVDAATMRPYAYAGEAGPERVLSPEHSQAWDGGKAGGVVNHRTFNVSGVGVNEFMQRIRAAERREDVMTGVRRG